jgi:hypothetical protein
LEVDRRLNQGNLDRRAKAARRSSRYKPKASARRFHQSNGPRLNGALQALRKHSRILRHWRAPADCFGANPVASALGNRTRRDPGTAVRTYHEGQLPTLKRGTFYLAGSRNFLFGPNKAVPSLSYPLSKVVARVVGSAWMVRNSRLAGQSACPTSLARVRRSWPFSSLRMKVCFITRLIQSQPSSSRFQVAHSVSPKCPRHPAVPDRAHSCSRRFPPIDGVAGWSMDCNFGP